MDEIYSRLQALSSLREVKDAYNETKAEVEELEKKVSPPPPSTL